MEQKELKQNDLVSFRFRNDMTLHRGIFSHISKYGNPVFVLTDMGYEKQEVVSNIFELCNILLRPAITNSYEYIKERLKEKTLEDIDEQISLLRQKKKEVNDSFLPNLCDILNYIDEDY